MIRQWPAETGPSGCQAGPRRWVRWSAAGLGRRRMGSGSLKPSDSLAGEWGCDWPGGVIRLDAQFRLFGC